MHAGDLPRLRLPAVSPLIASRFVTERLPRLAAASRDPRDLAVALARQQYGLAADEVAVTGLVPSPGGLIHVYLRQLHRGIEIPPPMST